MDDILPPIVLLPNFAVELITNKMAIHNKEG